MYLQYINHLEKEVKLYINPQGIVSHGTYGDFITLNMKPVAVETKLKDFKWGLTLAISAILNYPELTEFLKNVNAGVFIPDVRINKLKPIKKETSAKPVKKKTDQGSLEL